MNVELLIWFVVLIIILFPFGFRIYLTRNLFDYNSFQINPLDYCSTLNKFLLVELVFHSLYLTLSIIPKFSSYIIIAINLPFIIYRWYLYKQNLLFYSPLNLVRDQSKYENNSLMYILFYIINMLIAFYKIFKSIVGYHWAKGE